MLDFGREVTSNPHLTHQREWLVTNGIGGYATGTVSGMLTRVYHGLLVAALQPPLGRTVLVSKFDETVTYEGSKYDLFVNQWGKDDLHPFGFDYLERFRLEGTTPIWTYALSDARLEKRVFMLPNSNTTYIRYDYLRGTLPLQLEVKALVNYKDSHGTISAPSWKMQVEAVDKGFSVTAFQNKAPFYVLSDKASVQTDHTWYHNYYLAVEQERGLGEKTDHLHAGTFTVSLNTGESVTFVATTEADASRDSAAAYIVRRTYEQNLMDKAKLPTQPDWIQHLVLAADQFIVKRAAGKNPNGRTIIAGYHWFSDWGRDTMISLPGLTLATKRYDEAARILRTYAQFVSKGMLPNRFPDASDTPEYNTVDATLWYFNAIQKYYDPTHDVDLLRDLYPILQDIIAWHQKGTRYNIHVDPLDGLLYAGEKGSQLTWMDAKINDWVVTPRTGKPVEINALWYNALRSMADFARLLGELDADEYDTLANQVEKSFSKFWYAEGAYLYDVLETPAGSPDTSLRPNQLFAISLEYSPLNQDQKKAIVDICGRKLVTSMGLRTLSPDHADFKGDYDGSPYDRDSRYHQGTVWAWLMGAYVEAHLKTYGNADLARTFLEPFKHHLADYCIGSIAEVAQGDEPFLPKAAIAQAWSVAEVLRAWLVCDTYTV